MRKAFCSLCAGKGTRKPSVVPLSLKACELDLIARLSCQWSEMLVNVRNYDIRGEKVDGVLKGVPVRGAMNLILLWWTFVPKWMAHRASSLPMPMTFQHILGRAH